MDKVSNEEVLQTKWTKTMLETVKKCKHCMVRACATTRIITAWYNWGKNEGKATRGRKRKHLLSDLMKGKYVALKRTAEDRKEWQKLLRAGSHTPASQQITWMNTWMNYVCAYHCAQLLYRKRHRAVLIIFPLILQTIRWCLLEGRGHEVYATNNFISISRWHNNY